MFVCEPMHMYAQSDRCWDAIVIDFNAYWDALPIGGCHRLLAGHSCILQEARNGWQCNRGRVMTRVRVEKV